MSQANRTAAVWWTLLILWAATIFVLSAQSHLVISPDAAIDWMLRKSAHAIVFAVLAALALQAFRSSELRHPAIWAIALASVYAASDELHQAFVPGRTPFVGDVAIDIAGAAAGLLLISQRRG